MYVDLEKYILREKSKERKQGAKDLGQPFLRDLPEKRQQKYKDNPLKLITHLDLLFLFYTSVSKRGERGEFEDPCYYGLIPTTFYKMLQDLEKVGVLHCTNFHYEFKKGKSKAGFDYSKSKGCKRKYEVFEDTVYFKKISPNIQKWKAFRQLHKNCGVNREKDLDKRIKYPTSCKILEDSSVGKEAELLSQIDCLNFEKAPLTIFPVLKEDVGRDIIPFWGQNLLDTVFIYDKEVLRSLCGKLLNKAEESIEENLGQYIDYLNKSLESLIKENRAYEGFLRKVEPNCSVRTSKSAVVNLKTSWRATTAFALCSKQERTKIKGAFGWNSSVDIKSESLQVYAILGDQLEKVTNRSFYQKIAKALNWDTNEEVFKFFGKSEKKLTESVKQAVVRMMSVDNLKDLEKILNTKQNPILPSRECTSQLYKFLKTTLGFFDAVNLFYYTSFVEILTICKFREKGIFIENCYDEFYYNSKEVSAKEIRDTLTESCKVLKRIIND